MHVILELLLYVELSVLKPYCASPISAIYIQPACPPSSCPVTPATRALNFRNLCFRPPQISTETGRNPSPRSHMLRSRAALQRNDPVPNSDISTRTLATFGQGTNYQRMSSPSIATLLTALGMYTLPQTIPDISTLARSIEHQQQ